MLGVFASVLIALAQPAPLAAPEARSLPQPDFRLLAETDQAVAYVDLANIAPGAGYIYARIYSFSRVEAPMIHVADIRFHCGTRQLNVDTVLAYDRHFRPVLPVGTGRLDVPFEEGSIGEQAMAFVCGPAETRAQARYLGRDWETAARLLDDRFR